MKHDSIKDDLMEMVRNPGKNEALTFRYVLEGGHRSSIGYGGGLGCRPYIIINARPHRMREIGQFILDSAEAMSPSRRRKNTIERER